MRLRDELGPIYRDAMFAPLFSQRGRPAEAPWRLALVTVMQVAERLSDRRAADAVRGRIDWKYALGLPLDDPGFDSTVLCEFRARLLEGSAEQHVLDVLLRHCRERVDVVAAIVGDLVSGTAPTRVQLVVWPLDLIVASPALFWGGAWLWRREPLGYVVGGIVLKAAAEGLTLAVQTGATMLWGVAPDPLLPAHTAVGVGGLILLCAYLRCVGAVVPAEMGTRGVQVAAARS